MSQKTAKKAQVKLSFKPKQVTKELLSVLPVRARDIVTKRYGLGGETKPMTLEAIGKKYGITRERVRQIDEYSLNNIRKSKEYTKQSAVFDELKSALRKLGGIIVHHELLEELGADISNQNHVHFLLVLGEHFTREKEDEQFRNRWNIDQSLAKSVHGALEKLYGSLDDNELVPESELVKKFLEYVKDVSDEYKQEEIIKRWLNISHKIGKNPLGEWGKTASPNVKAKGIRDYAYLVIRKHGSPIHFRDVARAITTYFNKRAHVATTHNELIKDSRFVLVGRGLYALKEWGYAPGVVKDVIVSIIEKNGPLPKDKIIEKVLKERYVKENTILVNLQNPKFFKKDKDGKYHFVAAK
jgi:hypothetical protein